MSFWNRDEIQFPRLLTEIRAVGLSQEQYKNLQDAMDLPRTGIDEIFRRAEEAFDKICEACLGEGYLETTMDTIERCDACKKYKNDAEAKIGKERQEELGQGQMDLIPRSKVPR